MNLYMIRYPNGCTVKTDATHFAIIAETDEIALEKSLKYGLDGIIISITKMNKDWN